MKPTARDLQIRRVLAEELHAERQREAREKCDLEGHIIPATEDMCVRCGYLMPDPFAFDEDIPF